MCNPATMAFSPGLCPSPAPPASSPPRRAPPLIFQRLEDSKEEHALSHYANACQNYSQSKDKVKRQCNKSDQELLMENCHLYRTRVENAELLGRARNIEDCHSGEQLWAMSLREHWTVEPRIGDLYSTPIRHLKEGSQNEIEQVGSPYRESLHHLLADGSLSAISKQMSTWMSYKRFLKKCERKLAKMVLHTPDFPALEVVGTKLSAKPATSTEEKAALHDSKCGSSHAADMKASDRGQDQPLIGPKAELNTTELFLHGNPGDHVSSNVILHNTGSTSLQFEWRQKPQLSLCNVQHEGAYAMETPHFYIVPIAGILVPGESKNFYVEFHPKSPGTFIDLWILVFSPNLSSPLQRLRLLGAAVAPEDENSKRQRELLQHDMAIRQRTRGLGEIFSEIIENAIKQVQVNFKKAPDFVSSGEFFDFMRCNIACSDQTPLYYSPQVSLQFQNIAFEMHEKEQGSLPVDAFNGDEIEANPLSIWDSPVSNFMTRLDMMEIDENWKKIMKQKASALNLSAAIPAHPTAILNTAMYKTLVKIATQVEEILEERDNQNEMEQLSDSDPLTTFSFEEDSARGSSKGNANGSASLGGSTLKQDVANLNVSQDASGKGFGRRLSRQILRNANVGQVSAPKSLEGSSPSKRAPSNVVGGSTGYDGRIPTKLVNASGNNADGGTPQQALTSEIAESVETCEVRLRQVLQEGIVEQFWKEVESAFSKLAPIVKTKIECCIADSDEDSACWLSLWFSRLSCLITQ
ncbi:hypothetical protein L7F22_036858 [Adiantum nelumboides]|nr:hypothetical protein [Adiantum nelumboides]